MSMKDYTKWREENPEYDKDWQEGVGGGGVECVGEWKISSRKQRLRMESRP